MSQKKTKAFPKKVFIYVCDYDEKSGEPYYAVTTNLEDIPEDEDGEKVGSYSLEKMGTFKIERFITNM